MTFDETYDVVIAGAGCAAGGAAIGAIVAGAKKILVCEKSSTQTGGTTDNAGLGWMWVPNNRFLKDMGIKQDPEELVALLVDIAERSAKGHKVDEGDVAMIKAFAYHWPAVATLIEEKKFFQFKQEEVRSEEDYDVLEKLYNSKIKENPELMKKTGVTADLIPTLRKFMPSYCAENPLDSCPTGKVLSCSGASTAGFVQQAFDNHKDVVTLKTGYEVVDLIFEDERNQKVIGAVVKDVESGKEYRYGAKHGVIFGTGGFTYNKELMKKHFKAEFFGSCAGAVNTGDLIRIAQQYGIAVDGMDEAWVKQVVVPEHDDRYPGVFFLNADSFMVVDRTGKRFANEKDFYQERGYQMIADQKNKKVVIAIYDQRTAELHQGPLMSLGGPIPWEHATSDCMLSGKDFKELSSNIKEHIKKYVTDYELPANFAEVVQEQTLRFNGFAEAGDDKDFHRGTTASKFCWHTPRRDNVFPNKTMHPIDTSNLRALVMGLSTLDTRGGPRINQFGQIYRNIDKNEVVEGLYGAGNCIKSWAKYSYPASGVTIAAGVFFGYQAGSHALGKPRQKL